MTKPLEVVAAVICFEGKILCVQRGLHRYGYLSNKYEFPGGKTEPGESIPDALIREVREELALKIQPLRPLISITHHYPDFSLNLHGWLCSCLAPDLELREHLAGIWLGPERLHEPDWAAADLPVVEEIRKQAAIFS